MTRRRLVAASALLAWSALWFAPWQLWLQPWPWLGTALALALFIAPGMGLHAWITRGTVVRVSGRVTYGFALSVLVTGVIGLVGCVSHLSFTFVMASLWVVGLLGPAALALSNSATASAADGRAGDAMSWLDWLEGALVLAIAARLAFAPAGGSDDLTHVARITQFQSGDSLGFASIAFGDAVRIPPRYWLAYWPLCEAVLSALSGVHGLELTTNYLGPLLAPLAFVSLFELARSLGLSRRLAIATLAAQLIALVMLGKPWQPGLIFLNRVTEDKVMAAYLLAPAGVAAAASYFGTGARSWLVLALLVSAAIALSHPTIFGIAYLFMLAYCAGELLVAAPRGRVVRLAIGLTVLAAAVSSLRFVAHPARSYVHFTVASADRAGVLTRARAEQLWISADDRHYAVSRQVIPPTARAVGIAALLLACVQLRRQRAARYVAGALALVGLTLVPQTAWLLGLAVTPFHLWRFSWQAPFGLALVLAGSSVIAVARVWVVPRIPFIARLMRPGVTAVCELGLLGVLVGVVWLTDIRESLWSLHFPREWRTTVYAEYELALGKFRCRRTYADLIAMGRLIDERAPRGAVVVADPATNDFVPSVSSRARLLHFRGVEQTVLHGSLSHAEAEQRNAALARLFDEQTPTAERMSIFAARQVEFVLQCNRVRWAQELAAAYPDRFARVAGAGEFELYRVLTPVESGALHGRE